jgi:hypothetical protein
MANPGKHILSSACFLCSVCLYIQGVVATDYYVIGGIQVSPPHNRVIFNPLSVGRVMRLRRVVDGDWSGQIDYTVALSQHQRTHRDLARGK